MLVRSIVSVVVGFALWSALWFASQQGMLRAFPAVFGEGGETASVPILLLLLAISLIISLVTGYVVGLIGAERLIRVAIILGLILLAVGTYVQIQFWQYHPAWYHLAFLALLLPGVVVGAALKSGLVG